jgi:hypothetical protein
MFYFVLQGPMGADSPPQKKKKMVQTALVFPSVVDSRKGPMSTVMKVMKPQSEPLQQLSIDLSETNVVHGRANVPSLKTNSSTSGSCSSSCKLPTDISAAPGEMPSQPILLKYSESLKEGSLKKRSFSQVWFKKYSWIEYSITADAIYCQSCRFFGKCGEATFTSSGYRNWQKIGQKCDKHNSSSVHKSAVTQMNEFKLNAKVGRGTVLEQLDPMHGNAFFVEKNRDVLKVILHVILFCAKQDIALRGHRETIEDSNRGNFLELLQLIMEHSPDIKDKIQGLPANARMTSPETQNDLLEAAASLLLRKIRDDVSKAKYFAILADECKDQSKREIIGVSLRYVSNGLVKERAVGFVETSDLSAQSIAEKIVEVVSFFALDPDDCVGFSFDGASVMSGNRKGVQALLAKVYKRGMYTHCHSHRLNLVLSTATKSETAFKNMFDSLDQLSTYFSGTKRHAKLMELQKEMRPDKQLSELANSSATRWISWSTSTEKVLNLYDVLLHALRHFQEDRDGETRMQAYGLYGLMHKKQFLFLLVAFNRVFQVVSQATIALQKPSLSCDMVWDILCVSKECLKEFRDNDSSGYNKTIELTEELVTKYKVPDLPQSSRVTQLPQHLHSYTVTQSCGGRGDSGEKDANGVFRRLWYSLLDSLQGELDARFGSEQKGIMICVDACRPDSVNFMNMEYLKLACERAHVQLDEASVITFKKFIALRVSRNETFPCVASVFSVIDEDIFPCIYQLYKYIVCLPSTTCTVERMFSTMNRIKSTIRKSMLTKRLSHLSLLSFEHELVDSMDYDEVINVFKEKPRRLLF